MRKRVSDWPAWINRRKFERIMKEKLNIQVRAAGLEDLEEVGALYDALNDYLEQPEHENYPRWKKNVYPVKEQAREGIENGELYAAVAEGRIAGTVICLHQQEEAYRTVSWQLPWDVPVIVIHILAVHPEYFGRGVGEALLDHAAALARQEKRRAVRLDTYEKNLPASRLFEKCGFRFCGMADLGLEEIYGLKWYRTYEKILERI